MPEIVYLVGDATDPVGDGPRVIAHIVNDRGWWGRGFVMAVSARWPEATVRNLASDAVFPTLSWAF